LEREMAEARRRLLEVRDRRVRPAKDDKVLVSWNGLMIDAMAQAAAVLDEPRYLEAAQRAARFVLDHIRRDDGRLLHSWRLGQARLDAYLDDYAYFTNALVSLYESDFDETWIAAAAELADMMLRHFGDAAGGGFFFTADDHEQLIARTKDLQDASVPSGNAMAATALLRLGTLVGRQDYLEAARQTLELAIPLMESHPQAAGQMLIAADMALGPLPEVVVVGDCRQGATRDVLRDLHRRYVPNRVLACRPPQAVAEPGPLQPLFAGKSSEDIEPAVYVCQNFRCRQPVFGKQGALARWDELARIEDVL
jgi:uncharacterized protein YyaL (SSP411 family)